MNLFVCDDKDYSFFVNEQKPDSEIQFYCNANGTACILFNVELDKGMFGNRKRCARCLQIMKPNEFKV